MKLKIKRNKKFQVEFSADTLRLNLIDLARTGSKLIQVAGRVAYNCPSGDPQDPVTFTTRESHLVNKSFLNFKFEINRLHTDLILNIVYRLKILPPWETGKQSMISFKFRTNEPNGLILLSSGTKPGNVSIY